jgi:hypothetical protein
LIALHLVPESNWLDLVQGGQVAIDHHLVAADEVNSPFDHLDRNDGTMGLVGHRISFFAKAAQ